MADSFTQPPEVTLMANLTRKLSDTLTVAEVDVPDGIILTREVDGATVAITLSLEEAIALCKWLT
jgi:hypothetical protein